MGINFLVVFLAGLLGLLLFNSKMVADHFKEQIALTIYFKDSSKQIDIQQIQKSIKFKGLTKSAVFTSKDEASKIYADEIKENEPKFEKIAEVDLHMKPGRIGESVLLVTPPSTGRPAWNVSVLDFDQRSLPSGKFAFSSSVPRTLGLSFGESKFTLPQNTPTTVDGKMKEGGRTIELAIRDGSRALFSQQWPHVNGLRGMFYIGPRGDGVQVTRFVDFPKPVEQTLGYGLPRISKPDDENGDGFEEF